MITGTAIIYGYIMATWTDEQLTWNTTEYNGLSRMSLSAEDIWTPEFTQFYGSDASLSGTLTPVLLLYSGQVVMASSRVFEGICYLDVFRYPIDEHSCHVEVAPMRHDASEINFNILEQGNDHQIHGENGEWELVDSKQTVIYVPDETTPYDFIGIERSFTFRRRSLFTMIHTVLPLGLLSILNVMMYRVPTNSGERISYAVSIFLAFVFFTSSISDTLPNSSLTISCYSITVILINVTTTIGVIVSVVLSHLNNEESRPIPGILKQMVRKFMFKATVGNTRVEPLTVEGRKQHLKETDSKINAGEGARDNEDVLNNQLKDVTWQDVSQMFDTILFWANLSIVSLIVIISCILIYEFKR